MKKYRTIRTRHYTMSDYEQKQAEKEFFKVLSVDTLLKSGYSVEEVIKGKKDNGTLIDMR